MFDNKVFIRNTFLLFFVTISIFFNRSIAAQEVELQGKLHVKISDDLKGNKSKLEYVLSQGKKKTVLRFKVKPSQDLFTNMKIKVRGKKVGAGGSLNVGGSKDSFTIMSGELPPGLTGDQVVVVLRIQSNTSVSPATHQQLAAEVAATGSRAIELSASLVSISNDKNADGTPDVFTVSVNQSTAGVGESEAFNLCNQAKSAAGVSGYRHYICILPPDMNYGWYGQAYINGTDMVINGNYASGYPNGLLHEIGHNWGRHHANTPGVEYGDSSCIMGGNAGTANRHFNGPQMLGLGWLAATSVGQGSYQLPAVEFSAGQRLLMIRDAIANQDIYISTRARIGSYSSGPINPGMTHIHTWAGGANRTELLAVLGNGQSFTSNGITITQAGHDGSMASVQISTNCVAAASSVTITPSSIMSNTTSAQSYSVMIQNRDSGCSDPVVFNLNSSSSSTSLGTSLSSNTVTIAPGQSANISLSIAPGLDLLAGSYSLSVSASAAGHVSASGGASFVFDNLAPTQVTGLSGSVSKRKVNLRWTAAVDQGAAGLQGYQILRNGVVVGSATSNAFSDNPGSGTFTYVVRAQDRAGNIGAQSNSIQITVGRGR